MHKALKKRVVIWISIITIVGLTFCVGYCINKYNSIYHTIETTPSGINITFYDYPLSRGFSWWTELRLLSLARNDLLPYDA